MTVPKIGQTVKVRLFDGVEVTGRVVHVEETAEGTRVGVLHGSVLNNVMLSQLVS